MKYDTIIVGAGPAGIFTALELRNKGYEGSILIIEKGAAIENRKCPLPASPATSRQAFRARAPFRTASSL